MSIAAMRFALKKLISAMAPFTLAQLMAPLPLARLMALFVLALLVIPVAWAAEDCDTKRPTRPMSKKRAFRYCAPQTVNIEIIGHDEDGKWKSVGAGSILHEDGYILTAEHVTAAGDEHTVKLYDGTSYEYKVLGRAGGSYDTAVLKIYPKQPLPYVALGHSENVKVNEQVMVIGNAGGNPHTLNFGIVEKVACGGGTQIHIGKSDIKPGDSGGPVFNMLGEQIAHVHVKIFTLERASRHIRVDHLRDAFEKTFGDESRYDYMLGIGIDCHAGEAVVKSVTEESPAAVAGVKIGDVITRFGDMRIGQGPDYVMALMNGLSAETVTLVLEREGEAFTKQITPRRNEK